MAKRGDTGEGGLSQGGLSQTSGDRPRIVVFDVETTGTDRTRDQVIELCAQFGLSDDSARRVWRVRPEVEITAGAQAIHGIGAEQLMDCPCFAEVANEIRDLFAEADVLVGYNVRFDIEMLQAEFARLKQPLLDLGRHRVVDSFRLWQHCEPRTLQDAHRRFVGGDFGEAHSAAADVAATARVLTGMLQHFSLDADWDALAHRCEPARRTWIGPSQHLRWDDEGKPVLGFGRHGGRSLLELARGADADYLRWVCQQEFPPHVQLVCERVLSLQAQEFLVWVETEFGAAPASIDDAGGIGPAGVVSLVLAKTKGAGSRSATSPSHEHKPNGTAVPTPLSGPNQDVGLGENLRLF